MSLINLVFAVPATASDPMSRHAILTFGIKYMLDVYELTNSELYKSP